MLELKILLAVILSALPFIYAYYLRPKAKSSKIWKNFFTVIGAQKTRFRLFVIWLKKRNKRFAEGLKKSDNFRKFYTRITLLIIIAFQFVDFHATTIVTNMIQQQSDSIFFSEKMIDSNEWMITNPHATLLSACLGLSLFIFGLANLILTTLHNERELYLLIGLITLIVLFALPQFFIVAETLEIILIAAYFYPNKIHSPGPKGGLPKPLENEQKILKIAA